MMFQLLWWLMGSLQPHGQWNPPLNKWSSTPCRVSSAQGMCFWNTARSSASFPETEWEDRETDAALPRQPGMTQPSEAYSRATTRGRSSIWTHHQQDTLSSHSRSSCSLTHFFFTATNDRSDVNSLQRISVIHLPRHRCILGDISPKFNKWPQQLEFFCMWE